MVAIPLINIDRLINLSSQWDTSKQNRSSMILMPFIVNNLMMHLRCCSLLKKMRVLPMSISERFVSSNSAVSGIDPDVYRISNFLRQRSVCRYSFLNKFKKPFLVYIFIFLIIHNEKYFFINKSHLKFTFQISICKDREKMNTKSFFFKKKPFSRNKIFHLRKFIFLLLENARIFASFSKYLLFIKI